MSEQEVKDSQKTVVAFIAGLLVGGLLVWLFAGGERMAEAPDSTDETEVALTEDTQSDSEAGSNGSSDQTQANDTPELPVGDAAVSVNNQPAGSVVSLESATFPTDEGWIAVRQYTNGNLGSILGAIQYSKSAGRVPQEIPLVAPTTAGREYAIVFFSQDGNRAFNLDGDVQLDTPLVTFTAE
jgi:hypothetical protein